VTDTGHREGTAPLTAVAVSANLGKKHNTSPQEINPQKPEQAMLHRQHVPHIPHEVNRTCGHEKVDVSSRNVVFTKIGREADVVTDKLLQACASRDDGMM
jgi:hypothetical protein